MRQIILILSLLAPVAASYPVEPPPVVVEAPLETQLTELILLEITWNFNVNQMPEAKFLALITERVQFHAILTEEWARVLDGEFGYNVFAHIIKTHRDMQMGSNEQTYSREMATAAGIAERQ